MNGEQGVSFIFERIFDKKSRRTSLLSHWLCSFVPIDKGTRATPMAFFEYFIRSIAVDIADFKVTPHGVYFNTHMFFSNNLFSTEEKTFLSQGEHFDKSGTFRYNHILLTKTHRELLMRDFVNICFFLQKRVKRHRWPLYALIALQKIIFVDGHYLPCLLDSERVLQGLASYSDLPIHSNRGCHLV